MDKTDEHIKWCIENNACIHSKEDLERLSEGTEMFEKCAKCQTSKTGDGYDSVPPSEEWIDEDEECKDCECLKWFKEHLW